jgi:hypothetical protein
LEFNSDGLSIGFTRHDGHLTVGIQL